MDGLKPHLVRCGYLYVQGKGSEMTKRVVLFINLVSFVLGPGPSQAQTRSPDFDGNGKVDFEDFFLFAAVFGSRAPADLAKYDLDNGGLVDLEDFFMICAGLRRNSLRGHGLSACDCAR